MNKYFIFLLLISFSSVHAVDDERTFEKGVKKASQFFQNVFKENTKKELPKGSDVKPMGQTRPMPIVLKEPVKPAIIEQKNEAEVAKTEEINKADCSQKESSEVPEMNKTKMDRVMAFIGNNKGKLIAGVVAVVILYGYSQTPVEVSLPDND